MKCEKTVNMREVCNKFEKNLKYVFLNPEKN